MKITQTVGVHGCEIANDEFPKEFIDQIKNLSNYPILKVPIRQSGITQGAKQECYYNANLLSQTFGGKAIYGWAIDIPTDGFERYGYGCLFLHGHGNWLTPEGKLVDVTKCRDRKFRYFLPTDIQLQLNGEDHVETIKNFIWSTDREDYFRELAQDVDHVSREFYRFACKWDKEKIEDAFKTNHEIFTTPFVRPDLIDTENKIMEKWVDENAVGRICDVKGFPHTVFYALNKNSVELNGENTDQVWGILEKCFNFFMKPVTKSSAKVSHWIMDTNWIEYCNKAFKETAKTGKSIFEQNPNVDIASIFERKYEIWNDRRMYRSPVCGISTTTGKSIWDTPVRQDLIQEQSLPKDKNLRKLICSQAKKYDLNPKEFLLMTNPKYYPHPYLVRKSQGQKIPKIKIGSTSKSKGFA